MNDDASVLKRFAILREYHVSVVGGWWLVVGGWVLLVSA
jgi:hypothetical protein